MNRYIWTLWTGAWTIPQSWDLLCLAVSVGFVRRFCPNTEIYTDENGARLLDEYCIEGDRKVMTFDVRPSKYPRFAEAKLKTMIGQSQPFCHIDHDVFLLKEQHDDLETDIMTQSVDTTHYHQKIYKEAYEKAPASIYPAEMVHCAASGEYTGYNCGYLAVRNLDILKEWCSVALGISAYYSPQNKGENVIIEQMPLYALAKCREWKVGKLFSEDQLNQLGPELAGYVHLMGSKDTDRSYVTGRLVQRAKEVAPDFYNKCFAGLLPT